MPGYHARHPTWWLLAAHWWLLNVDRHWVFLNNNVLPQMPADPPAAYKVKPLLRASWMQNLEGWESPRGGK